MVTIVQAQCKITQEGETVKKTETLTPPPLGRQDPWSSSVSRKYSTTSI